MKKGIVICLIIAIIIVAVIIVVNNNKDDVVYVTDNEYLYDVAIDYLKEEYTEEDKENKDKDDFKIFFDYEGFGITVDENIKYAYMWIVEESYYIEDGEVKSGSGSSMPYKIKFVDDVVVDFETAKDGAEYDTSIKEMFPEDVADKILTYNLSDEKIKTKVEEHYAYLNEEREK